MMQVARKRPVGNRPLRKSRTGMGEGEVDEGWVVHPGGVVRHGPFGRLRAGFSKDYRLAHHERV